MKKEELIQELKEQIHNPICEVFIYRNENFNPETLINSLPETIADYIIRREKLLLEKIGRPLREYKVKTIADYEKTYGCDPLEWGICEGEKAIDSALAIIEKESKQ